MKVNEDIIFQDRRRVTLNATPEEVWGPISRLGGENGWHFANWLWQLRGWIDKILGGVGMRGAKPGNEGHKPNDKIDFWHVEKAEPQKHLLLRAEMKLPGKAFLEFRLEKKDGGETELQQIARFIPDGLGGLVYWYASWPLHQMIFRGMLNGIAKRAEKDF